MPPASVSATGAGGSTVFLGPRPDEGRTGVGHAGPSLRTGPGGQGDCLARRRFVAPGPEHRSSHHGDGNDEDGAPPTVPAANDELRGRIEAMVAG